MFSLKKLFCTVAFGSLFLIVQSSCLAASTNADSHKARGLGCIVCHETEKPEPMAEVSSNKCIACHGTRNSIASRSAAKWGKKNPHDNHLGEIECALCHKGHEPSESYCLKCHRDFQMPMK